MKIGRDHADLCRDTAGAVFADLYRGLFANVWIVKTQHRHRGAHQVHRQRILRRVLDKIDNSIRQLSLPAQLLSATLELLAIRQFVVPKKINNFLVTDFAGQLVDVVAAVNQLAFVANDVAQSRGIGDDAFESA